MKEDLLCFYGLVSKEMHLFRKEFISRFIDLIANVGTWIIVFGYFMGSSGLNSSYSGYVLIGCIASFGLFDSIMRSMVLAQDVTDKKITNVLTLPLSSTWVFSSIAISWALGTAILSILLFPIGKIVLGSKFDLSNISVIKFILIFSIGNVFYGYFSLWIASLVSSLRNTSWIWSRLINPLFMFCGFFYTWKSAYELSPFLGYFHLINPLLYVLEGTKASVFGQAGYLNYWGCVFILILFTLIFGFDAIRRLKKRIDCV
jgi:ABC-2 type transport system permease protein